MRGRARGHQERIIILAHQIEIMARQKTLKAVKHYLPKEEKAAKPSGTRGLVEMFKRIKARQAVT
ncbi:hypothetical protein ACKU27_00960 [Sphingobium yanoikuyae]|jgi:hypothetical protein|uniref:hypothetical protein n=1 Tax=Sphingobium yanoikuyae TaxID=13690 RepID=UPI003B900D4E